MRPLACDLGAFNAAERRRYNFSLRLQADPPSIRLELGDGDEVKQFLRAELTG